MIISHGIDDRYMCFFFFENMSNLLGNMGKGKIHSRYQKNCKCMRWHLVFVIWMYNQMVFCILNLPASFENKFIIMTMIADTVTSFTSYDNKILWNIVPSSKRKSNASMKNEKKSYKKAYTWMIQRIRQNVRK